MMGPRDVDPNNAETLAVYPRPWISNKLLRASPKLKNREYAVTSCCRMGRAGFCDFAGELSLAPFGHRKEIGEMMYTSVRVT